SNSSAATMAAPMPRPRTGGRVTSERNRASSPCTSMPPKPTGTSSVVSKRQNSRPGASTSEVGRFARASAAISAPRSPARNGWEISLTGIGDQGSGDQGIRDQGSGIRDQNEKPEIFLIPDT